MKLLVATPTTTLSTTGNVNVVGANDAASALNDITHFSVATIPDLNGNTFYANAEHIDQFFTAWTYSSQATVGTRGANAASGFNANDGSSISYAAQGGDNFVYVNAIDNVSDGQMVAILEGQQKNQKAFSANATSTDSPLSEWLEAGATGLIPATVYKPTINSSDFPNSALMLSLIHISEPTRPY